jgi:tetratricopeptide (TPR) repeat protein
LIFFSLKIITAWSADIAYAQGKTLLQYGPSYLSESIVQLSQAVKTNPNEPLYYSILAESQAQASFYLTEQIKTLEASAPAETKKQYQLASAEYATKALTNSQKALDMNPHHTNYYKSRAKVELFLASNDPKYYPDVITTLLKLSTLAPTDAKIIYNLGLVYINTNKKEDAIIAFKKALDLKPDYYEAKDKLKSLTQK